jgi:hypothetical protein
MSTQTIPSQLQSKLQKQAADQPEVPLIVEAGNMAVSYAVQRSIEIARQFKTSTHANNPAVLLLFSQEDLSAQETTLSQASVALLSEDQSPREDLSLLHDESMVLATTPQRAIDHIRRDNILLTRTQSVVLAYHFTKADEESARELTEREQVFLDDCRFVFTKLSSDTHRELFIESLDHLVRSPQELMGQPVVISRSDWEQSQIPIQCYPCEPEDTSTVLDILSTLQQDTYIVVHHNDTAWRSLKTKVQRTGYHIHFTDLDMSHLDKAQHIIRKPIHTALVLGCSSEELVTLVRAMQEWEFCPEQLVCICLPQEAQLIISSKETLLMNTEKKTIPESDEVVAGKIQMLVAKLAVDSHPEELESLRKLFKKFVPFHRRGYFTAYLLRELLSDKKTTGNQKSVAAQTPKTQEAAEKPQRPKRQSSRKQPVETPEGARTLYLNIGKMRRLYAKELSQILQDKLGITRDDIFSIRVHDKYSFITLSQEHAEKAIEAINGMDIRGRTATITYSNKE